MTREPDPVDAIMHCDHAGCLRQVRRAPRMRVPSRTPWEPDHTPLLVMTTLHYCDLHRQDFQPASYWTDARKAEAEALARSLRPLDFRLDFERCRVELLLVTTPEYRRFLTEMGFRRVVA